MPRGKKPFDPDDPQDPSASAPNPDDDADDFGDDTDDPVGSFGPTFTDDPNDPYDVQALKEAPPFDLGETSDLSTSPYVGRLPKSISEFTLTTATS
jgi:hypothetical protein